MKKSVILKIISVLLAILALVAIDFGVTVTGSGFLDLSNVARAVCFGVAIVFAVLAVVAWKISRRNKA